LDGGCFGATLTPIFKPYGSSFYGNKNSKECIIKIMEHKGLLILISQVLKFFSGGKD
jgi:hypothetical protein